MTRRCGAARRLRRRATGKLPGPGAPGPVPEVFDLSAGRGVVYVTGEFTQHRRQGAPQPARRSALLTAARPASPRTRTRTRTATARRHRRRRPARSTRGGSSAGSGGLPRDSFARLDPVTGHARPTRRLADLPPRLLGREPASTPLTGDELGCEGVEGPLGALSLPAPEPDRLAPRRSTRLRRRGARRRPGLLVAVSATSRFAARPPHDHRLAENGRRLFTSPARPTAQAHAVAVTAGSCSSARARSLETSPRFAHSRRQREAVLERSEIHGIVGVSPAPSCSARAAARRKESPMPSARCALRSSCYCSGPDSDRLRRRLRASFPEGRHPDAPEVARRLQAGRLLRQPGDRFRRDSSRCEAGTDRLVRRSQGPSSSRSHRPATHSILAYVTGKITKARSPQAPQPCPDGCEDSQVSARRSHEAPTSGRRP